MFKLYKQSQIAQAKWIRAHPVQYVALNAALFAAFVGYIKFMEIRELRKLKQEETQQEK